MKKQSKNYIGFVNDHSGSMNHLAQAAAKDYNGIIKSIKEAASNEKLDTIVSVVGIGFPGGAEVTQQVVISNPHVLEPINHWSTNGGTPLYDGIANIIDLYSELPDSKDPHVSFLIMITTDGEECSSRYQTETTIKKLLKEKMADGRWTFVFRVPKNATRFIEKLGIPPGNIQEWDTTTTGMATSSAQTQTAVSGYFSARAGGASASSSFYANATQVNVAALNEVPAKDVSLYVVPAEDNGIQIQTFILRHRQKYLKGAAFYHLSKTETKVGPHKLILIRDRQTGKFFSGPEARTMLGLPTHQNVRLHPGDHANFDLFIQSESINRKLVGGYGVAYMAKLGTEFTQAEIDLFTKPAAPKTAKPAVVVLPKVAPTNKPTKSPIPVTPRYSYFDTREEARTYCRDNGVSQQEIENDKTAPKGKRWFIPTAAKTK